MDTQPCGRASQAKASSAPLFLRNGRDTGKRQTHTWLARVALVAQRERGRERGEEQRRAEENDRGKNEGYERSVSILVRAIA